MNRQLPGEGAEMASSKVSVPTPSQMRESMGSFATGVTVVTGLDSDGPVGFACQSFASVSLDPPLVLFCADHRGRAWPRIQRSGRFTVNILSERQVDLCTRFGSRDGAKFAGLDWTTSRWETPSLPDVLTRIHAEVSTVHIEGDHEVVVGRVLELESPVSGQPLLFYRGKFGIETPTLAAPELWGWGDRWG